MFIIINYYFNKIIVIKKIFFNDYLLWQNFYINNKIIQKYFNFEYFTLSFEFSLVNSCFLGNKMFKVNKQIKGNKFNL